VSLFDEAWVWWSLGSMLALSVTMTFVLPKLHRPRKTGLGNTGLPEYAALEEPAEGPAEEPVEPGETVPGP
jgi:UDP-GlcNAc:undecaprenyl-phosphate/decaprenyl-phosphate GlcNAc-1-phosphate transferase